MSHLSLPTTPGRRRIVITIVATSGGSTGEEIRTCPRRHGWCTTGAAWAGCLRALVLDHRVSPSLPVPDMTTFTSRAVIRTHLDSKTDTRWEKGAPLTVQKAHRFPSSGSWGGRTSSGLCELSGS